MAGAGAFGWRVFASLETQKTVKFQLHVDCTLRPTTRLVQNYNGNSTKQLLGPSPFEYGACLDGGARVPPEVVRPIFSRGPEHGQALNPEL